MIRRLELYMILRDKRRLKVDVMDNIVMNYHFTNLNRENDKGSNYFVEFCGIIVNQLNQVGFVQEEIVALIIFNSALYRFFGTIEYASEIKFVTQYNLEDLVTTALVCRKKYGAACTEAYTRVNFYTEKKSLSRANELYIKIAK